MPLTPEERQFLDAYVYEATHGPPFGGPATQDLGRRNVRYSDLGWLLTAYQRELSAEGIPAAGVHNPNPPPSPWRDLDEVRRRGVMLKEELDSKSVGHTPARSEEEEVYEKIKLLFGPAETERILREEHGKGRPLAEIWKDLKARAARS